MEWDKFPEGEEPEILTGISGEYNAAKHAERPGFAPSAELGGETVFGICDCHRVPSKA